MQKLGSVLEGVEEIRPVPVLPWHKQLDPNAPKAAAGQSRRQSWIEAWVNIAVGIGVSIAANWTIMPILGYDLTWANNLYITAFFTAVSLVRSYLLRRFFNKLQVKGSK